MASCSFLASSLCDLLYRFEELCSVNEDLVPLISCTKLRKSIDNFHYDIVKRLNSILLQRRPTTGTTTSGIGTSYYSLSNLSSSQYFHNPTAQHSSRTPAHMAPTIVFQRKTAKPSHQKGYLLPVDLENSRNRLQRSKSMSIRNLHLENSSKKLTIDQIESRWKDLLSDEILNIFESKDPKSRRSQNSRPHKPENLRLQKSESLAALKAACKLTRSVVDEISKHVDSL